MDNIELIQPTLQGFKLLWHQIVSTLPQIIAGLMFLLLGLVVAMFLRKLINHTLTKIKFDTFIARTGITAWLEHVSIQKTPSNLVASLTGLFIFLIFLLAAVDSLGLSSLSALIDTFTLFLPKLFAALIVMVAGCFIAQAAFATVKTTTKNMGIDYGRSVAEVARGILIIITLSLSISQLDIDVTLLNWIIGVICASVGLAAAISMGIGSRSLAQEILSGVYLRDIYQPGDVLKIGETQGTLAVISTVSSQLVMQDGSTVTYPNTAILENKVVKVCERDSSAS